MLCSSELQCENKRNLKDRPIGRTCPRAEKAVEYDDDDDSDCICRPWDGSRRLRKETWEIGK